MWLLSACATAGRGRVFFAGWLHVPSADPSKTFPSKRTFCSCHLFVLGIYIAPFYRKMKCEEERRKLKMRLFYFIAREIMSIDRRQTMYVVFVYRRVRIKDEDRLESRQITEFSAQLWMSLPSMWIKWKHLWPCTIQRDHAPLSIPIQLIGTNDTMENCLLIMLPCEGDVSGRVQIVGVWPSLANRCSVKTADESTTERVWQQYTLIICRDFGAVGETFGRATV